jgi:hypothetical protein
MPKGIPFKKGADPRRGDNGRRAIPEEVKRARKLTSAEFELTVSKIISMTRKQLENLVADDESNALEQLVGTIWLKGIKDSSKTELNYFIERFLGKVAENHNFQGNFHTGLVDFIEQMKQARAGKKGLTHGEQKESDEEDFEEEE